MKKYTFLKFAVLLLFITQILSSCTKVIDVDIKDQEANFVVEGFVTLGDLTHRVSITKTLNLDDASNFPTVDNASIYLTDDLGNGQNMVLVAPGVYEVNNYPVSEGRTYTIQISVDGKVFVAAGKMPVNVQQRRLFHPLRFESEGRTYTIQISVDGKVFVAAGKMPVNVPLEIVETFPFSFGPEPINALVPIRFDPAGIENYYQFNLIVKGKNIPGNFIQSDQYNDGNINQEPIFATEIKAGDTVDVVMFGIDKSIYNYFFTLEQNIQGATPANPTSNFSGGCLGYFSVRTKSAKQIIIPL